ncbi:methyltransferase family protein [Sinobacterium caligoides]|uniref:Methyltransferase family protein n=1 Tax=Sinobacterium caligoides TaxID=933926 RepID=A0A3N2DDT0_9GAMM|nr:class I SAM-dependent methyltransferase [Sinobacterium caligoides]ROR97892.1 methyltransferase family protein [Sinobacterium caligoides]
MIKTNEKHAFSANYSQSNDVQFQAAEHYLQSMLGNDFKYLTWLDVGCGDGKLMNAYSIDKPSILRTGIDLSARLIEEAKNNAPGTADFKVLDARELARINKSYQLVTSFFCLQWLSNCEIKQVFSAMIERLSPGGHLVIILPIDQTTLSQARQNSLKRYTQNYTIPLGVQNTAAFELIFQSACQEHNMQVVSDGLTHFKLPGGTDLFKQYISGWMSELRECDLTVQSQQEYLSDIVNCMPKNEQGEVDFSTHAYCLHASKASSS